MTVDGERLRQRINLDGSRILGVEVVGTARPVRLLTIEGHLTYAHTRAFLDDGPDRELTERPAWLGTVTMVYNAPWGLSLMGQSLYTGRAYGLNPENELEALNTSLVLNTRIAYRFLIPERSFFGEFFVRLDNLTDTTTLPQLGLPGPGREIRGGVSLSL